MTDRLERPIYLYQLREEVKLDGQDFVVFICMQVKMRTSVVNYFFSEIIIVTVLSLYRVCV